MNNFKLSIPQYKEKGVPDSEFGDQDTGIIVVDPICLDNVTILCTLPDYVIPLWLIVEDREKHRPTGMWSDPYWLSHDRIASYINSTIRPGQIILLPSIELLDLLNAPILGVIAKPLEMWEKNLSRVFHHDKDLHRSRYNSLMERSTHLVRSDSSLLSTIQRMIQNHIILRKPQTGNLLRSLDTYLKRCVIIPSRIGYLTRDVSMISSEIHDWRSFVGVSDVAISNVIWAHIRPILSL
jgi:hypothetical protein